MHTSAAGLRLIEGLEGYSAYRYDDGTGVMTIGYGTTSADGPLPWHLTRQQAEALLQRKLATKYEPAVNRLGRSFGQGQFDALVSFAYNLGPGIFAGHLGDLLRRHEDTAFANAILAYDHAGGVELLGLKRRREAERALFLHGSNPSDPLRALRADERQYVEKFDALRPGAWRHPVAFARVRRWLAARRKAIWRAAHGIGGWGANNRAQRYRIIRSRVP